MIGPWGLSCSGANESGPNGAREGGFHRLGFSCSFFRQGEIRLEAV